MNNVTANNEQSIHMLFEKFTESWNIHDAESFALLFCEDADFTNVFGLTLHGRAAIEKMHSDIFKTMFKDSSFSVEKTSIRFLTQDLAAADVLWNMSGATDFKGNPWLDRKGLMNLIIKNEAGNWRILIMHNMDLPVATLK